ncbi:pyridoxal-phosphate dependent enzyme [Streptomyces sp. NBC_00683]|uniref:pyridoxal-phosphate dependent enzyme n=1 Tax=Streptomyces sp. NBC_00683 TaxID=2903670 RepID=UPI002E3087AB|nr:pyridoxal-phosphate dependent enzyme [Streptomyces sp. NBC_00683]
MRLTCSSCTGETGGRTEDGPNEWLCLRCGGGLTPHLDDFRSWSDAITDVPGVGRYTSLLPVAEPEDLRSSEAALSPVESPRMAELLGVASFRFLPQSRNETGTFKDNEGVLLAAKCKEWELPSVCLHSSGNTVRAYQYYMERAGIVCTGFVPQASAYKCPTTAMGKSSVVPVPGNMADAAAAAIAHSKEDGALRLTPSQWKIEGKVPLGLALAERCADATRIAVTIASGYGPLGIERGILRARSAGLASVGDHSFELFQAEDAGLMASALRDGNEEIDLDDMVPPEIAFEPTLQSTNPNRTLPLVRQLVTKTGSRVAAVSSGAVEAEAGLLSEACEELDIPLDYATEKSAYICWAGLRQAALSGGLAASDRIVMIVSGSAPHDRLP